MAKSRKPWYRARNVALFVLAAAIAWLGWAVYIAVTSKPGAAIDYGQKMYDLAASYQPGGPSDANAWDTLTEAVAILNDVTAETHRTLGKPDAAPEGWDRNFGFPFDFNAIRDPAATAAVVDQTLAVMDTLRERGLTEKLAAAAATPRALRPRSEGRLLLVLLPELGSMRNLARYGGARMYLAHVAGDSEEQTAAFEATLAIGRVACSQPTLIERMVGQAIITLALTELRSEMGESPLTPEACRRAVAAMERQLGDLPPLELALNGERIFVLDSVQWTHTDDGRGSGRLLLNKLSELQSGGEVVKGGWMNHPLANVAGFFFPSKAQVVARTNEHFDGVISYAKLPRAERASSAYQPDVAEQSLPRGYMVLKIMLPALGKAVHVEDAMRMQIEGTRLALAIQLFQHDNGRLPNSLDELVPGVLRSMPIDAISGKPYGYRLLPPEEDPHGWGYLLYSLGVDGVDDGGKAAARYNSDALGKDGKGSDFIVNAPRSAN